MSEYSEFRRFPRSAAVSADLFLHFHLVPGFFFLPLYSLIRLTAALSLKGFHYLKTLSLPLLLLSLIPYFQKNNSVCQLPQACNYHYYNLPGTLLRECV